MGKEGIPEIPSYMKFSSDDCDRPACEDTISALSAAMDRVKNKSNSSNQPKNNEVKECPPTKGVLGSSTWTLLHSMAAWYPDKPTLHEQTQMTNLISSLATFYPCTWCAQDFRENLKLEPVKTASRKELCIWMCKQHNVVNEKLGKATFKCNMKDLDERWRKSKNDQCNL